MMTRPVVHKLTIVLLILLGVFLRLHNLDMAHLGFSHDEGFNAYEAVRLADTLSPSLFYAENNGREPLHIYAGAAAVQFLGNRPWTFHLLSAYIGILALPLIYILGRDFSGKAPQRSQAIGLFCCAVLALSFWHVLFSRLYLRAIFMLPLSMLAVWLFWQGLRRPGYFVLGGVALGLSLYSYLPARLLPVVFTIYALISGAAAVRRRLLFSQIMRRPAIKGALVVLLIGGLIFLPLGMIFVQHPDYFFNRIQQTALLNETRSLNEEPQIGANLVATARMFIDRGDVFARYNLPGRPALNILAGLAFWIGLFFVARHPLTPANRLLLLWLIVMLLPTIFSKDAPNFVRALGALPAAAILAGFGLAWASARLKQVLPFQQNKINTGLVILIIFVFISSLLTYRDYFILWTGRPDTVAIYGEMEEKEIGELMVQLAQERNILLSGNTFFHGVTRYTMASLTDEMPPAVIHQIESGPTVLLQSPGQCRLKRNMVLYRRAGGGPGVFQFLHPPDIFAGHSLVSAVADEVIHDNLGNPSVYQWQIPVEELARVPSRRGVGATFASRLCLLSYELASTHVQPGEVVNLTLYWEGLQHQDSPLNLHVEILTAKGDDAGIAGTQKLEIAAGEVVATKHTFYLPPEMHEGKYQFKVELVREDGQKLSLVDDWGVPFDDNAVAGNLTLTEEVVDPAAINFPLHFFVGQDLGTFQQQLETDSFCLSCLIEADQIKAKVLGYDVKLPANPGDPLDLTLYFESMHPFDKDYTLFVHLIDENGQLIVQQDSEPMAGRMPTSFWLPGEIVVDRRQLPLPNETLPGEYRLAIGFYDWLSGSRLPLVDENGYLPNNQLNISIRLGEEN